MKQEEVCKKIVERHCPMCGRVFIPAPYHIYRKGSKMFCSWGCYNAFLTSKEQETRKYNPIHGRKAKKQ